MNIVYKKSKDDTIFMAVYGYIGFIILDPMNLSGKKSVTIGVVKDATEIYHELESCNRYDFDVELDMFTDSSVLTIEIINMYKSLVKTIVKKSVALEELKEA